MKDKNGKEILPGDLLQDVSEHRYCDYHICFERGYGIEIRDLHCNNVGMTNPDDCINLGHITTVYKSLPKGEEFEGDDWEYYFGVPAFKDPECGYQGLNGEPDLETMKANNFPEGWTLPEEDKI